MALAVVRPGECAPECERGATSEVPAPPESLGAKTSVHNLSDDSGTSQPRPLPNLEGDSKESEEDELSTLEEVVVGVEVEGAGNDDDQESVEVVEVVEAEGWQEQGPSEPNVCDAEAAAEMTQAKQKRSKSTLRTTAVAPDFRSCCTIPDAQGGYELCVLEAGHTGKHQLPDGGTRNNPEPGGHVERVGSGDAPQAPQAQPSPRAVAKRIVEKRPSNEVCDALIADVLKEFEGHLTSLKRQSGCSVGRVIDGIRVWYVPAKHQGGEWFALLPCGRKVQGRRAIMEAIKMRALHFNDEQIAERLQFGLNVVVGEIEAADPIVQRALRAEGSNVQQEEHYVTLPIIATPEGGKAFANMNDAELRAIVVQGQAELNEREIRKRTVNVIDESRDLLRLEEARVAQMRDEADAREALLEQGEAKLAQEMAALEKQRTACAAEFAEKRQKLDAAVAALRDSL